MNDATSGKPWTIVEIHHPELRPTRLAHRGGIDIDAALFSLGFTTAGRDDSLPYPARYPLVVYIWRAEAFDEIRPATGVRKTRARNATYAEARDRTTAIRKATPWTRSAARSVMRSAAFL